MSDELNKRLTDSGRAILDVDDAANRVRLSELKLYFAMHIALLGEDALEVFDDKGDVHIIYWPIYPSANGVLRLSKMESRPSRQNHPRTTLASLDVEQAWSYLPLN